MTDQVRERLEKASTHLESIQEACRVPSISYGVYRDGEEPFTGSVGFRDVEKRLQPTPETAYLISSISKSYTAAAVAILVDQKKMNWSDLISKHLPEFNPEGNPKIAQKADIVDLLRHTSSLLNPVVPFLGPHGFSLSSDDTFMRMVNLSPTAKEEPGEKFAYSSLNYMIAAKLVEKVSGSKSYAHFVQENILSPMHLDRTFIWEENLEDEDIAYPYGQLEDGTFVRQVSEVTSEKNSAILGSLGFRSSVNDLYHWAKAFMQPENLQNGSSTLANGHTASADGDKKRSNFQSSSALESFQRQVPILWNSYGTFETDPDSGAEAGICLGWIETTIPSKLQSLGTYNALTPPKPGVSQYVGNPPQRRVFMHGGLGNGISARVLAFPDTKEVVVALCNGLNVGDAAAFAIDVLLEALFDLQPRVDIADRMKVETGLRLHQYDNQVLQEWHKNKDKNPPKQLPPNGDYEGTYSAMALELTVRVSEVGGLELIFGNRIDHPFPLEYYKKDQYSYLPLTRDKWVEGGWLDWDNYMVGILVFHRNKTGKVAGLYWTWERGVEPMYWKRNMQSQISCNLL